MMKKTLIITFLIFTISLQAQQANPIEEKVTFSVKAGWINSTLKGGDLDFLSTEGKVKNRNNFLVGLGVGNPIGNKFSLKHEVLYQNHGADFKRELEGNILDAELIMHSLRINPISVAYRLGDVHIFAGPYINLLLSSSITAIDENGNTYKDDSIFGTETENQEEGHFLQNMDIGFLAGAEYHFDFGGLIGVQFSRGLATIFDNANTYDIFGPEGPKDLKIYNQTLSVYLGYKF